MDILVTRARQGDKDAFGKIVMREQARVRGYVAARLGDPDTAEDVAQETFVVAWTRIADFDPSKEMWPWLRGIARKLIQKERSRLSKSHILLEEFWESSGTMREGADRAPVFDALASCVGDLSDKLQRFVDLRYFENMKLNEVAEKVGFTPGSARVVHVKLLRALRDCVNRYLNRDLEGADV